MEILIVPDSYKDCLPARAVADCLKKGFERILTGSSFTTVPFSDGGEGTVKMVIDSIQGKMVEADVHDPLMRKIRSYFGVSGDGKTAYVEMAAASGLELLSGSERDPWITSTYGTGELIAGAIDLGCKTIVVGMGGSATNDGGTGMAKALGAKFLDGKGEEVRSGGGYLNEIETIDLSSLKQKLEDVRVVGLCDVQNPLTGPDGAAYVYAAQKGASPDRIPELDRNLMHLAGRIEEFLHKKVAGIKGAGAAGGFGAGLVAFLDADLVDGFEYLARTTGLHTKVARADLVVTGEGKIDAQSRYGKTIAGIAKISRKHKKPLIVIAGTVEDGYEAVYDIGADAVFSIARGPVTLEQSLEKASDLLTDAAENIARLIKCCDQHNQEYGRP